MKFTSLLLVGAAALSFTTPALADGFRGSDGDDDKRRGKPVCNAVKSARYDAKADTYDAKAAAAEKAKYAAKYEAKADKYGAKADKYACAGAPPADPDSPAG